MPTMGAVEHPDPLTCQPMIAHVMMRSECEVASITMAANVWKCVTHHSCVKKSGTGTSTALEPVYYIRVQGNVTVTTLSFALLYLEN